MAENKNFEYLGVVKEVHLSGLAEVEKKGRITKIPKGNLKEKDHVLKEDGVARKTTETELKKLKLITVKKTQTVKDATAATQTKVENPATKEETAGDTNTENTGE